MVEPCYCLTNNIFVTDSCPVLSFMTYKDTSKVNRYLNQTWFISELHVQTCALLLPWDSVRSVKNTNDTQKWGKKNWKKFWSHDCTLNLCLPCRYSLSSQEHHIFISWCLCFSLVWFFFVFCNPFTGGYCEPSNFGWSISNLTDKTRLHSPHDMDH